MSRHSLLILLLSATLLACRPYVSQESFQSKLDTEVTLGPGERAVFAEEQLEVRFVGILEDSRCPINLTCVWAGEVRIRLTVQKGTGEPEPRDIRMGESETIDAYRLSVLDVAPQPLTNEKIPLNKYRVTLKLERAEPAASR